MKLIMLDIRPGSPINDGALAAELGVGRTPVREALKRLETDHLVVSCSRRGTSPPSSTSPSSARSLTFGSSWSPMRPAVQLKTRLHACAPCCAMQPRRSVIWKSLTEIGTISYVRT
jgi:DNA-binding FadR family transcriptional regulator